jgi:prepilin-type processing-associated H-X9-DG protein
MFFGYQFIGSKGMFRMGDRLEWQGDRFSVMAADLDRQKLTADAFASSHPDADGRLTSVAVQDAKTGGAGAGQGGDDTTISSWWGAARGAVDKNVLFLDGSVERFTNVAWNEPNQSSGRMVYIPERPDAGTASEVGPISTASDFVSLIPNK